MNIGPGETRKRLVAGFLFLAVGGLTAAVLARPGIHRGWRLLLFAPFWFGALGLLQAWSHT